MAESKSKPTTSGGHLVKPAGLSSILAESLEKEKKANQNQAQADKPTTSDGKHAKTTGLGSIEAESMEKEKKSKLNQNDDDQSDLDDTDDDDDSRQDELSKAYEKQIESGDKKETIPLNNKISFKDLIKNKKSESKPQRPLPKRAESADEHEDGEEVFERGAASKAQPKEHTTHLNGFQVILDVSKVS